MQTATTIEQSRRLLELGIPVWTADMEHHMGELRIKRPEGCADDDSVKTPAWTLSALLEMLPQRLANSGFEYELQIHYYADRVEIAYVNGSFDSYTTDGLTLFEAAVDMIHELRNWGQKLIINP